MSNDQEQEQGTLKDLNLDGDNEGDVRSSDEIFEQTVQESQTKTFIDQGDDVTYPTQPSVDGYEGDPAFDEAENYFQKHFIANSAGIAKKMDYFEPAYRFGFEYGVENDTELIVDVEDDLQQIWTSENPDTWDRFKSAVLYGWKIGSMMTKEGAPVDSSDEEE